MLTYITSTFILYKVIWWSVIRQSEMTIGFCSWETHIHTQTIIYSVSEVRRGKPREGNISNWGGQTTEPWAIWEWELKGLASLLRRTDSQLHASCLPALIPSSFLPDNTLIVSPSLSLSLPRLSPASKMGLLPWRLLPMRILDILVEDRNFIVSAVGLISYFVYVSICVCVCGRWGGFRRLAVMVWKSWSQFW